jgi:hypothetical protein
MTTLKDWLPFIGTIAAALIAGIFAVYQLSKSHVAQRELEREKLQSARTEAELAQVRSSTREYQQAQVLPFLEQLDLAINESYKAAYLPPYFPRLGGFVPQLLRYSDRAMADWMRAIEAMSRHRIRLLLVLSEERIKPVASLLTELIDLMKKILEVRHKVWYQEASEQDLWNAQRSYVSVGYRLMMEIRDAVSSVPQDQAPISEEAKKSLADALTTPFEKASAVSIPYGTNADFSWIAIWEVDMRPEIQAFIQSMTKATHEDFENQLRSLMHLLYEKQSFIDVQLAKVTTEELEVPCLAVSFASAKLLNAFMESEIESYRQAHRILWTSYRSPIEIVIGSDNEKEHGPGSSGNKKD